MLLVLFAVDPRPTIPTVLKVATFFNYTVLWRAKQCQARSTAYDSLRDKQLVCLAHETWQTRRRRRLHDAFTGETFDEGGVGHMMNPGCSLNSTKPTATRRATMKSSMTTLAIEKQCIHRYLSQPLVRAWRVRLSAGQARPVISSRQVFLA